jgi:hypothetical protein
MNATGSSSWLGYPLDRSQPRVGIHGLGDRILLLGRQAGSLASLFAYASAEAGPKLAVLDLDGSISPEVQGYFRSFDHRSMLYEAFHLEGEDPTHGQLVASAYAAALDLSPEEEAILSAAMQKLSEQNDLAAPSALYDALSGVEGFRGFYVDKLKGRIGSLRSLDSARNGSFDLLMAGGTYVSFASAPYPQAADLAAALFIAKVLHLLTVSGSHPDALMVTGSHRLFKGPARFQHEPKLLAHLLEARVSLILSSPLPALLSDRLIESMQVRVYSSEAWNGHKNWKQPAALACSYTICDDRTGVSIGFVPRFVRPRRQAADVQSRPPERASPELTRTILEEISKFDSANRQSVVSYLSPQFLAADIGAEIDRLHSRGCLVLEPKQEGSGPKILAYTVTELGRRLLQGLSK